MGADQIISAAATVSLFPNGIIEAETRIETPHKKELKEMVSTLFINYRPHRTRKFVILKKSGQI